MAPKVGKMVGNGKTTKILETGWVGGKKIKFKSEEIDSLDPQPLWVSDLIGQNNEWDNNILIKWFEPKEVNMIKTIHIPAFDVKDEYTWNGTSNGEYLIKSGYWFGLHKRSGDYETSKFWKRFWSQNFWPKWKIFYWKLANGALATGVNLRKRKILSESPCPLCGCEEESDTHLFKDCEITRRIWSCSSLGINSQQPNNLSVYVWSRNWLWYLMDDEPKNGERTFDFINTLWCIWLLRNKRIFKPSSNATPKDFFEIAKHWKIRGNKAWRDTEDIITEQGRSNREKSKDPFWWGYNWANQEEHATMIVDGAWKINSQDEDDPGKAAFGWFFQDRNGEIAKGNQVICASSALQTEALAVLLSMKESLKMGYRNIEVWTDSKLLVAGLYEEKKAASNIRTIILDIRETAKIFNSIRILNVIREKVSIAHSIAVKARRKGSSL
ncbi:uncharacterized protein LOC104901211 [Beta vulgaris subsp. vulgaris]|uniref:uncharacterized protein LOC104901211 n=1 Tax=Beta vulgaris subsp. vulgaris TaxID=3555 RepID=UPI00053F7D06|nr:uncharacterized protein LOC104901211 [Beta vulgaris subsp. vulgaris]